MPPGPYGDDAERGGHSASFPCPGRAGDDRFDGGGVHPGRAHPYPRLVGRHVHGGDLASEHPRQAGDLVGDAQRLRARQGDRPSRADAGEQARGRDGGHVPRVDDALAAGTRHVGDRQSLVDQVGPAQEVRRETGRAQDRPGQPGRGHGVLGGAVPGPHDPAVRTPRAGAGGGELDESGDARRPGRPDKGPIVPRYGRAGRRQHEDRLHAGGRGVEGTRVVVVALDDVDERMPGERRGVSDEGADGHATPPHDREDRGPDGAPHHQAGSQPRDHESGHEPPRRDVHPHDPQQRQQADDGDRRRAEPEHVSVVALGSRQESQAVLVVLVGVADRKPAGRAGTG